MRLWHKDLIPVLPRQQLLGQWRECCAIMSNIAKNCTPNHVLVNKVMDYPLGHFYWYSIYVWAETRIRGYKCKESAFNERFRSYTKCTIWPNVVYDDDLFAGWHDVRYLRQCYYNLQEKYDCGAITDEEWRKIEERYEEMMGGSDE